MELEKRLGKNQILRNTSTNATFLRRLPIRNYARASFIEVWGGNVGNLTRNFIKYGFLKKTIMPVSV